MFSKENPSVKLILDFADTERDIVQEGIDLAIRMGPPRDSALKVRKLSNLDRMLVAATSYFESRPIPKSPEDLLDMSWIELSPVGINYVFKNNKGKQVTVKAQSQLLVNNAYALLQLIKNGNGPGVLPSFLVQKHVESGELQALLEDWKTDPIETYAVWPGNAPKNGLTRRLINFIVGDKTCF
jgi:DNA-binding transcriptional LysR family regulator